MDVFSHGIWTFLLARIFKKKVNKKISVKLSIFYGILPDLFAFSLLFIWMFSQIVSGNHSFMEIGKNIEEVEPAVQDTLTIFKLTSLLYSTSHSIFIFAIIIAIVSLAARRFVWEMMAWLFHILIDIPTHSYKFYPTPFLWPLSSWKFDGISWGQPWFMAVNYSLILMVYIIIRYKKY